MNQFEFNLTPLFDGDDDPKMITERERVTRLSYDFINKWKDRTDYLENASVLLEALNDYEAWNCNGGAGGDEDYYFWLRCKQNGNDPVLKAKNNNIQDFMNKISNDILFFELSLTKISPEKQTEFLTAKELKDYRAYLTLLFKRTKYTLSEPEEKIIRLKDAPAYENWVKMLSGFLAKSEADVLMVDGTKKLLSFSEIGEFISNSDLSVRTSATEAFNNIISANLDVAENEINSILADKKINDNLRGYQHPEEGRLLNNNIEIETVNSLIFAVSGRYDIAHRFYNLKSRLLGLEKLDYSEKNLKYGQIDKLYPWEEGVSLVTETLNTLDKEFADIFSKFLNEGAIDAFPRKGKADGAYCVYIQKTQPTYIMLNYANSLNDILTLAHEVGHGINDELMKKQNALNFGTSTATAETASTFMEDFVLENILKEADDELRLSIMMMKLNDLVSSIFRQVALYKFEQNLHQDFRAKGYLSKTEIGILFKRYMCEYLGESVVFQPGSENWWVSWSHIRRYFYTYSYAGGLLISKALQNKLKADPEFISSIKKFLSAGKSASPKDIFLDLGIDIDDPNFWQTSLNEIETLLNDTEALAKKLNKI